MAPITATTDSEHDAPEVLTIEIEERAVLYHGSQGATAPARHSTDGQDRHRQEGSRSSAKKVQGGVRGEP